MVRFDSRHPFQPRSSEHLWQQSERGYIPRPDEAEISPVDRRNLRDSQTLGDSNHGHIGRVETSIFVEPYELGHAPYINGKQINQFEHLSHKVQEPTPRCS